MNKWFQHRLGLNWLLSIGLVLSACSDNQLADYASTDSDEALFADAEILINDERYLEAIAKLEAMSVKGQAKGETRRLYASAQAGDCGLNFINFFSSISEWDGSAGGGMFSLFMAGFSGTQVKPASCAIAMEVMRDLAGTDMIGNTADDQLFMTILGMATMGSVLSEKADINQADGTGDGTVDTGFDICSSGNADDVTNAGIAELVAGFGTVLLNIGGLAGGDGVSGAVGDMATACEAFKQDPSDPNEPNPCAISDPANVDNTAIIVIRKMLHNEGFVPGNTCDPNNVATSCCPSLVP